MKIIPPFISFFLSTFYKINFLSALITTEISRGNFRDFSNRNPRDYEEK